MIINYLIIKYMNYYYLIFMNLELILLNLLYFIILVRYGYKVIMILSLNNRVILIGICFIRRLYNKLVV